ncbi:hypothetical protein EMCG_01193 [[Emmonsia] crescens]|uniref:Bicarbonate transporter-like transmembrane domain-containing protein n=1 Tax=[Emmonsia] crescens TaxID=73230 RepID=A0A0G2I5U0_9EURO|nr:hypothetical protein EMCG_01193 [Emmonsia crescens UAMH 3008]
MDTSVAQSPFYTSPPSLDTIFWVGFVHILGRLKEANISKVPITMAFHPTQPRNWLISFWELDIKWIFVAIPFEILTMLLFYYDHLGCSISTVPLKKSGGFHWDFFLLGCTTFVAGTLGLPMPNGLVPHAPVHTDSLTIYETDIVEGAEVRRPVVKATAVVEQRVSHFFMGLALIGTMTGPLLAVLHTMPAALFAGVFFVVGWGSIESNGIIEKLIFIFKENRFIQRDEPMLTIRRRFPVLICLLIPLHVVLLPKLFNSKELEAVDDLTANNKVVLASLGGAPILPRETEIEDYGRERRYEERKKGVTRQRTGSVHR